MTLHEAATLAGADYGEVRRWITEGVVTKVDANSPRYRVVAFRVNGNWEVDRKSLQKAMGYRKRILAKKAAPGVVVGRSGGNRKIGRAYTTMVASQSCPADCAFRGAGCYAEYDNTGTHWKRVNAANADVPATELARQEAEALDGLAADRDVRLHVAGDSATTVGTMVLAAAAARYMDRALAERGLTVKVFTYTHAWRQVPRSAWGRVAVLASCETVADVLAAEERGYAAAIVAPVFPTFRAHDHEGLTVVPCPAQSRGDVTCVDCRLCMNDGRLHDRKLTIGFETHGSGKRYADEALQRIALPLAIGLTAAPAATASPRPAAG